MKVEELSYSSVMYRVTEDKIEKISVRSIRKLNEKVDGKSRFVINEDRYSDGYKCVEGDTVATNDYTKLFFDLEDAKLEQAVMREDAISQAHKNAQKALEYYNALVLKYLYAPISNPE